MHARKYWSFRDGTYLADPDLEWEEEVEETKHGGS